MKKVLLTGLITAIISMEGYAGGPGGKGKDYALHNKGTMIIEAGTTLSAADGRVMRLEPNTHTYVAGRVEWAGKKDDERGDGSTPYFTTDRGHGDPGTVHIQDHALALQESALSSEVFGSEFQTWYRPTRKGFVHPAIKALSKDKQNVKFVDEHADLGTQAEAVTDPEKALVLLSVPGDSCEDPAVMNLTGGEVIPLEVDFAIGNIPLPSPQTGGGEQSGHGHRHGHRVALDAGTTDDESTPHSLVIIKKVRLNGNQEFFRAPGTAVLVRGSGELTIGNDAGLFQTPIGVAEGSVLKIGVKNKVVSVNATQKITIGGKGKEPTQSRIVIGKGSTLELTDGAVLKLLGDRHEELTIKSLIAGKETGAKEEEKVSSKKKEEVKEEELSGVKVKKEEEGGAN